MSNRQFLCKNREIGIVLNYQKVQKNQGKILKMLQQINALHLLRPDPPNTTYNNQLLSQTFNNHSQIPLLRSGTQQKAIVHQQYTLNPVQAVQMIWRAAKIAKDIEVMPCQLQEIEQSNIVGEKNDLSSMVKQIKRDLHKDKKNMGRDSQIVKEKKSKLKRLKEIRNQVRELWSSLRSWHHQKLSQVFDNPMLGLIRISPSQRQKQLLLSYIKNVCIELDTLLFRQSLIFIRQAGSVAYVKMQQSYIYFQIDSVQLKQKIGVVAYQQLVQQYKDIIKNYQIQKETLKYEQIVMCHRCMQTHRLQSDKGQTLCLSKTVTPDRTVTPFVYKNIILQGNYEVVPELYSKSNKKHQQIGQKDYFKSYAHPFYMSYATNATCSKFICKKCEQQLQKVRLKKEKKEKEKALKQKQQQGNEQMQEDNQGSQNPACHVKTRSNNQKQTAGKTNTEKSRLKKKQQCQFCLNLCECERCVRVELIHKMLGIHNYFGGRLEDITSQFVFCNMESKQLSLKRIFQNTLEAIQIQVDLSSKTVQVQAIIIQKAQTNNTEQIQTQPKQEIIKKIKQDCTIPVKNVRSKKIESEQNKYQFISKKEQKKLKIEQKGTKPITQDHTQIIQNVPEPQKYHPVYQEPIPDAFQSDINQPVLCSIKQVLSQDEKSHEKSEEKAINQKPIEQSFIPTFVESQFPDSNMFDNPQQSSIKTPLLKPQPEKNISNSTKTVNHKESSLSIPRYYPNLTRLFKAIVAQQQYDSDTDHQPAPVFMPEFHHQINPKKVNEIKKTSSVKAQNTSTVKPKARRRGRPSKKSQEQYQQSQSAQQNIKSNQEVTKKVDSEVRKTAISKANSKAKMLTYQQSSSIQNQFYFQSEQQN